MNAFFRSIVALRRGIQQSRVFLLLMTFAAFALASVSHASAQQTDVRITELQCNQNPEVVTITNEGNGGQDLSGWTLRSDPVASEFFDLSVVGVLAPSVSVFVQSGPQAQGSFVWSPDFVFRDSDATDFAQVVNAQGRVVHEVRCQSPSPTTAPSATASPARPAPTAAPTTAPIDVVPVGGGPPVTGSWQSAGLILAAGTWLIAALIGAILIARLRQGSAQLAAVTTAHAVYHSATPTATTRARGRWLYLALVLLLGAVAGLSASERGRRAED